MCRRTLVLTLIVSLAAGLTATQAQNSSLDPIDETRTRLKYQVQRALPSAGLQIWIPSGTFETSAMMRVPRFPSDIPELLTSSPNPPTMTLGGVRNEQISAQLAVASTSPIHDLSATVSTLTGPEGATISTDNVQIRFVRYVPVEHSGRFSNEVSPIAGRGVSGTRNPDIIGDPLAERGSVRVPHLRAQPIWFTFRIPKNATPGEYTGTLTVHTDNQGQRSFDLALTVHHPILPDPANDDFYLNVWMNHSAVAQAHNAEPWSERHWNLLEKYMADQAALGQNVINTTVIHEPWQVEWAPGIWRSQTAVGYASMVDWTYDGANWSFDYTKFDRYVQTALEQGVGPWIGAYSMLVFRGPQRLTYYDERVDSVVVERVEAGSERWEQAWTAFLQDFEQHLRGRGWLDRTMIAFDERPADLMKHAYGLIQSAAPVFADQIHVAGSPDVDRYAFDLSIHPNHLLDDEEESEHDLDKLLAHRREAGEITSFYVTTRPPHPNSRSYSPAVESRMLPWFAPKFELDGFLRWAYNSWPTDVYRAPVFRYAQGNEYFVYPGRNGPASSVRWELLRDGIEDVELLRQARASARVSQEELNRAVELATRSPDGREKDLEDLHQAREIVLEALGE